MNRIKTNSNYLTRKQLEEYFEVSRATVTKWEKQGMPFLNLGYRTRRYKLSTVIAWLNREETK